MSMVVRILAGDNTNLHYNFVVAKPLVPKNVLEIAFWGKSTPPSPLIIY